MFLLIRIGFACSARENAVVDPYDRVFKLDAHGLYNEEIEE